MYHASSDPPFPSLCHYVLNLLRFVVSQTVFSECLFLEGMLLDSVISVVSSSVFLPQGTSVQWGHL